MVGRLRQRPGRIFAPFTVAGLLAAAVALLGMDDAPGWLAWCPPSARIPVAAALGAAGTLTVEAWLARRQTADEPAQRAVNRLHRHLARQIALPTLNSSAAEPLLLRVHPAAPLEDHEDEPESEPARRGLRTMFRALRLRGSPAFPAVDRSRSDPQLPAFVEREAGEQLQRLLRIAGKEGGFVVLVGNSCVGKTRLLYETTRQVLSGFAVLAPDLGDGGLINEIADTGVPLPPLLVWLDELQRFLPGPYHLPDEQAHHTPLSARAVRQLLQAPTPVVIVGTLWPEYLAELRAPETNQQALDILNTAHTMRIDTFSPAERAAAANLANTDRRLKAAVVDPDFNVTEALAGAPQLLRRYQLAPDTHKAIIHAAVDARRLGIRSILTPSLLRAAARGYLSGHQPDDTWFDHALAELTSTHRRDDRATAPLLPLISADRRTILGYTVADYLLQHLTRARRSHRLSGVTWQALIDHTHDPYDQIHLANAAAKRMLYRIAETLYTRRADAGDKQAARSLAELLADQGRIEETLNALRRADSGHQEVIARLAQVLAEQGRVDDAISLLRDRREASVMYSPAWLVNLLERQGRADDAIELLRARADAGDTYTAHQLASLLERQGRADEALALLRVRIDAGDELATTDLSTLLERQHRIGEAIALLRPLADTGDGMKCRQLASLLERQGRAEEAITLLRAHIDSGDTYTTGQLVTLLEQQDRPEEAIGLLRPRVDAGDVHAAHQLAGLLERQGRADEAIALLRPLADMGSDPTAVELAELLERHDRAEEAIALLRPRTETSDMDIAGWLTSLLERQGRVDEAIDMLRVRADAGEKRAADRLVTLLERQGRVDEAIGLLDARSDAGDKHAAWWVTLLLERQGRAEEAINLLRARVDGGDEDAVDRLVELLKRHGRIDEVIEILRSRADANYAFAPWDLIQMLGRQGRIDELRKEVNAGTFSAGNELIRLFTREGARGEAEHLRRYGVEPANPQSG
ncbi:tetratricopeptide repeat protein [Streptomyces decoyicus]|uniref:tetratricopeptide repeat protein n=1 Tax=Streptomyces decoyicus TaxID=249567 RepID=UPI0033EFE505